MKAASFEHERVRTHVCVLILANDKQVVAGGKTRRLNNTVNCCAPRCCASLVKGLHVTAALTYFNDLKDKFSFEHPRRLTK